ncbi:uncharacterized protein E0L32_010305 [Thyridium curvatum]|uniref:Glycoside hydrolase 131 catalytic N-terminal domain-containing protein n=1 Tax=Thyridium curvatum TaxID=1093900 RepID=A0A507ANN2_9PEZI|nr:uncharacterized protein E0L32_010305 [Thyridium curvatum]TPX07974.1 hypothetical protein E0L32_010305 [Thyridium curvatum]
MHFLSSNPQTLTSLVLSVIAAVKAQQCSLQFDGRVPGAFSAATFDTQNNIFSPKNVFGQGSSSLYCVDVARLDQAPCSYPVAGEQIFFDDPVQYSLLRSSLPLCFKCNISDVPWRAAQFDVNTVPVEVTISDQSIFAPSANNVQTGFRRAELLIASNTGTDASTTGVKTLHFSLMKDAQRPLNLSHEYQLVFLESNDFSTNQIVLKTGTILGQATANPDTLQLFGNVKQNPPQLLFSTPFRPGAFHNFAVTLDFNALNPPKQRTTQVFFSAGASPLQAVTQALKNDVSGQGQFHFGVLKKGLDGGNDIVKNGVQEAGINEGIIFGGIFEEDSSAGCVSLSP